MWNRRHPMAVEILRANIEHLKARLSAETDPKKRGPLERQLAAQENELAALIETRSQRRED